MGTVVVNATSVLCAAGRGTPQLWASVRAGISKIGSSPVMDRDFEPVRMGLVPEDALEPKLPPEIDSLPLPGRARRLLRLGAPCLRTILEHAGSSPVRLFLGLPQLAVAEAPWLRGFALYLAKVAGASIDAPNSRVVASGRAAALVALELALDAVERDPMRPVVVGGIDTYFDLRLLADLGSAGRILGARSMDGFIPGEGAGFVVLSQPAAAGSQQAGAPPLVTVLGAASVTDPAHREGTEPARGEGLAQALGVLRSRIGASAAVRTAFAGLNGESFDAKLWGVARLRHSDFFSPRLDVRHPAEYFGDTGAAAGAILLALAVASIAENQDTGPSLVWAASDGESRGCALLSSMEI